MTQQIPPIISISSGKGGVGKTTFSVNLATALSDRGQKILLIDGDLGLGNVDVLLGLQVSHTLQETVEEGRDPQDLLVEVDPRFFVLPASSGVPEMAALSQEEQAFLTAVLGDIIGNFDLVLIDTAAGIGDAVLWFNQWATENIIILTPDPTSLTDAYALMKVMANRYDKKKFQLVVNNVKSKKEALETFTILAAVMEKFIEVKPSYLGPIPQDSNVVKAIRSQRPFLVTTPNCRAGKAVRTLAEQIEKSCK